MNYFAKMGRFIKKIRLVDRCLIVFMAVMMMQAAYNLFVNEANSEEIHGIDTVLRTTSAAIFGYFLSVNFIKKPEILRGLPTMQAPPNPLQLQGIPMGFASPSSYAQALLPPQANEPVKEVAQHNSGTASSSSTQELLQEEQEEVAQTSNQQIIIAATVGISSLLILIVARNFLELTPSTIATITQMRDFVSGCVGFLIGSPSTTRHE